jgi:hypothetical protein
MNIQEQLKIREMSLKEDFQENLSPIRGVRWIKISLKRILFTKNSLYKEFSLQRILFTKNSPYNISYKKALPK